MYKLAFVVLITTLLSISGAAQSRSGLQGVWKLTEITSTGAEGSTEMITQPSMYLFTKKHYSVIYVRGTAPRSDVADITKATADELRSIFVSNFISNAGTYEYNGGKLTLRPTVAKSPAYMQAGSFVTFAVTTDGKTATLVSESNKAGPVTNKTTYKLTRVE